jgi:ABC-type transporter Mla subunit MlaD
MHSRVVSLEQASAAHASERTAIFADLAHLGGIVTSVAEDLSHNIDALDQLVRTAQLTVGNLREQQLRLQPVVSSLARFSAARIAAPEQLGPLRAQLDVSAARTAGV